MPDYILSRCPELVVFAFDVPPFARSPLKSDLTEEEKGFVWTTSWANECLKTATHLLGFGLGAPLADKPLGRVGHSRGAKMCLELGEEELTRSDRATFLLQPAINTEMIYRALSQLVSLSELPVVGDWVRVLQNEIFAKQVIHYLIPGANEGLVKLYLESFKTSGPEAIARTIYDLGKNPLDISGFTPRMAQANILAFLSLNDRLVTYYEVCGILTEKVHLTSKQVQMLERDHCSWNIERSKESLRNRDQLARMWEVGSAIVKGMSKIPGLENIAVDQESALTMHGS